MEGISVLTSCSWYIAVPVALVTYLVVMREAIYEHLVRFFQRRHILGIRKRRKEKIAQAKMNNKVNKRFYPRKTL